MKDFTLSERLFLLETADNLSAEETKELHLMKDVWKDLKKLEQKWRMNVRKTS